ncbi:MAG: YceI family protein [Bacteroidota bacterium]|nr:YceI family protein [Bacteroidota bacterium]
MKKLSFLLLMLIPAVQWAQAKYFTKDAVVSFFSDSPMEKIEATNTKGTCVLDGSTGNLEFAVLVTGFQFEKALMQEHFKENYMEVGTYPKATFKGKITNFQDVNLKADGTYQANVQGNLTIHGVTKPVNVKGQIKVSSGQIIASTTFDVACADYNIKIPAVVKDNIAKVVKVKIESKLQALNQ